MEYYSVLTKTLKILIMKKLLPFVLSILFSISLCAQSSTPAPAVPTPPSTEKSSNDEVLEAMEAFLLKDNLIKDADRYKLRLTSKNLIINKKWQSDALQKTYYTRLTDLLGQDVGADITMKVSKRKNNKSVSISVKN